MTKSRKEFVYTGKSTTASAFIGLMNQCADLYQRRPFSFLALIVVIGLFSAITTHADALKLLSSGPGMVLVSFVTGLLIMTWIMQYLQQNMRFRSDDLITHPPSPPANLPEREAIVFAASQASIERLETEIENLGKRANINLSLGCAISLIGIGYLGYFAATSRLWVDPDIKENNPIATNSASFSGDLTNRQISFTNLALLELGTNPMMRSNIVQSNDTIAHGTNSAAHPQAPLAGKQKAPNETKGPDKEILLLTLLPRLSFVVFTELFAFFFLKLYKANLSEIRSYQNEITNLEMKYLAARLSEKGTDTVLFADVVRAIASTERNFLLQKDQTTVDLEHARLEHSGQTEIVKSLVETLKKK